MNNTELTIGALSHAVTALGFLGLAVFALIRWNRRAFSTSIFALAGAASCAWALAVARDLDAGAYIGRLSQLLEIARSSAWLVLLLGLLYWIQPVWRVTAAFGIVVFAVALASIAGLVGGVPGAGGELAREVIIGGRLVLAVAGLALVENLFRNTPSVQLWKVKYLCLGLGALFAYDFYIYSNGLLFRGIDGDLFAARGVTNLCVLPLLAVFVAREKTGAGPQIALSRRFALHSVTIIGAGLYLIAMAAAAYSTRIFGGKWTTFLQAIFLFGSILLLLVPLSSGGIRAAMRIFVEKSLFTYKYDYRREWLRFIQTVSLTSSSDSLGTRVVEAIGNIVESPDGGVWIMRSDGTYRLAAAWNLSRWKLPESRATLEADAPLAQFLERTLWIVDLYQFASDPRQYAGLETLPDWLRQVSRAWLVIPLPHHNQLLGFIVLGRPRTVLDLSWEDFDLLKTVARQAASYLAEQEATVALDEARQFEAFNKRFAFVVHDIKNLASQLSLILTNAAKYRGNVAFQDDMIETVRQSVEKINRMLTQLNVRLLRGSGGPPVELAPILRKIAESKSRLGAPVALDLQAADLRVPADEERLRAVIDHLVQNAIDAVGDAGEVRIRLIGEGPTAVIEIEDNGPGMDDEFVRDQLFRPFATTKGVGYGIGAYESREFAVSLGGGLDVSSLLGQGTVMRMRLPTAALTL